MTKRSLDEKELKFVHEYVSNGFNGTKAYLAAFELDGEDEKDRRAAGTGAYRLLKKQPIQDLIDVEEGSYKALAREMEMDRKEILKEIKNIVWGERIVLDKKGEQVKIGEDGKTKIAAINTLIKLTGDFTPEKREVDFGSGKKIDTSNMSDEEIKELQDSLLNEL